MVALWLRFFCYSGGLEVEIWWIEVREVLELRVGTRFIAIAIAGLSGTALHYGVHD